MLCVLIVTRIIPSSVNVVICFGKEYARSLLYKYFIFQVFNVVGSLTSLSGASIYTFGWRNAMMIVKHQIGSTAIQRFFMMICWVCNFPFAYTKECYRCHATIEKNGGCNHMICSTCKAEFCWTCLGPWEPHGSSWYHCNRFNETDSQSARNAQAVSASDWFAPNESLIVCRNQGQPWNDTYFIAIDIWTIWKV